MHDVVVAGRLTLAIVFGAAAVGKILNPVPSARAADIAGLPPRIARAAVRILIIVEIATAAALVRAEFALAGAIAALLLLGGFTLVIGVAFARGQHTVCGCFGSAHGSAVTALVRNQMLAALAAAVIWHASAGHPGPDLIAWIAGLAVERPLQLLAAATLAACSVAGVVFLRRGSADPNIEPAAAVPAPMPPAGPEIGTRAPFFSVLSAAAAGNGRPDLPVLVIFVDPTTDAMRLPDDLPEKTACRVVRVNITNGGVPDWVFAYRLTGVPAAVMLSRDGFVASRLAVGAEAISALAGQPVPAVPVATVAVPAASAPLGGCRPCAAARGRAVSSEAG